jgi:hypothetical protein
MDIQPLTAPWQRAMGAMFRRSLEDHALLFVYPHTAPRLFHTYFCPPLRIVALDRAGEILSDQVVAPNRVLRLPSCRLVVEADPDQDLSPETLRRLAQEAPEGKIESASWEVTTSIDRLLFALLKEAVADMRRVFEAHQRRRRVHQAVLKAKFAPWERGQLTNSANFLINFSYLCEIPETALQLSWQVLDAEADCLAEITAASMGGVPWQHGFPIRCLRCGKPEASWRSVLAPDPGLVSESAWRYGRPENHISLCRRCAAWLGWAERTELRVDLAQSLWGRRFDSFTAWCQAVKERDLPADWDRESHPLWPASFGGETWEAGSGAFAHTDPHPPDGVCRAASHLAALLRILNGKGGIREKRGRGKFLPWRPLMEMVGILSVDVLEAGGAGLRTRPDLPVSLSATVQANKASAGTIL